MPGPANIPCPGCGAALVHNPGSATLACWHCGKTFELQAGARMPWRTAAGMPGLRYYDTFAERRDEHAFETSPALPCHGCAAEISLGEGVLADQCPFCFTLLSPSDSHAHHHVRPHAFLPFTVTEREARARLKRWAGSLWAAPSALRRGLESGRPIAGVFLPFFLFTLDERTDRPGLLVPGSPSAGRFTEQTAVSTIHGWDLQALQPFDPEALAGFRAERPAIGPEAAFVRVVEIRAGARKWRGRTAATLETLNREWADTPLEELVCRHILLPVWFANYRARNMHYAAIVNGRTGAVSAERQWSEWPTVLALLLTAGTLIYLFWLLRP